jgi:hypothetical protein
MRASETRRENPAKAGASARQEYQRRRLRDAERRRSNRWLRIVFTVATPIVVYTAVRVGLPWAVDAVLESLADNLESGEPATGMDSDLAHPAALLLALAATVTITRELWGRRRSTEAWAKGAQGEVATGRIIDALPEGFIVRHDLRMPGSRANIDHVVVGPTGLFTVETKNYKGGVRVAGGRVTAGGRRSDGIVEEAKRQAAAIGNLTGAPARPIVVVHGGVELGWFSSPVVDGVRFSGPRRLAKVITRGDPVLSPDEVVALAARLGSLDAPARQASLSEADCACGGHWVERRRRADGAPFLGCSRYPTCRSTRSITSGTGAP